MNIEQRMHELLCAYALGEADAAQRIEVERALAATPELRRELEKIEETIGLVRETLGEGETMSRDAEKALMSAVNPEPQRSSWHASGWMRMAAGFLVLGGSAMLLRTLYENNTARMSPEKVAKLEESERRMAEPQSKADADESLLVARAEQEARANKLQFDAPKDGAALKDGADRPAAKLSTFGYTSTDPAAAPAPALQRPPFPVNQTVPLDTKDIHTWRDTSIVAAEKSARSADAGEQSGGVNLLEEKVREPAPVTSREAVDPSANESTTVGAGAPAKSHFAGRKLAPPADGRQAGKGTYRGPGDATPAGGGAGGSTAYKLPAGSTTAPSPSGPGTSGPSSPSSPAPLGARGAPANPNLRFDDKSTTGKAKAEELAKKGAEQKQAAGAPAEQGFTMSLDDPSAASPAEQAQVRLRALLERADSAGDERLARLKGLQSQDIPATVGLGELGYAGDDELTLRQLYFKLTPEQRAALLDQECRRVFDGCRRLPNERPRDMFFRYWGDNPFEITALDALSTFSADVDTASYALARRYLVEGKLPEKAQIRTEEFVNYFKADVPAPTKGTFAIHTDLAPSRFAQPANSTWTLRVVVRGKELAKEERKPLHLTCVIDCSGSMREQNRMETVKDTLRLLLTQLNSADMVGIVAFSTEARQVLPLTSVGNRGLIEVAIQQLEPDGWTNSEAGLKLGYETALAGLDAQATNRVIFLSDGVANQGETDPVKLSDTLKPIRERGVYLNTIGVGMNNHNDTLLEQLADKGDGMCSYVDDMREAKRVMMDNFMGSVETIARDVKIQVEFDPAQVVRYRLLGYENRAIADADFRNDKVDAGEVGSGHQVTALYELERSLAVGAEKPLATVRLRWKAPRIVNGPANEEATEIAHEVRGSQQTSFEGADAGYRRAVIVGQFAEFLRRSVNARGRSLDDLLVEAHKLEAQLPQDTEFHEFVALAERSKQLVLANIPNCDEICQAIDAYRTMQFQCAQAERLNHERQQQIVEDLARRNREMEEQIRELLRRRLESTPK